MYFEPEALIGFFLSDKQVGVLEMSAPLLRIVSWAMLPLAILNVLTGALRGAGDTRVPVIFTLVGFLGVRVPIAWWLCFHAGYGVSGAWYAMATDLCFRCVLAIGRFAQGGWQWQEV